MSVDLCGGVSFLVLIVCLLYVDDGGGGRIAKLTRPVKFEETTPHDLVFVDWQTGPCAVVGRSV